MERKSENWAVVGGGMLGMTLAHRLAQAGKQVTVYEAAPEFGGLASAWQIGNVIWDKHYHVTLLSDSYLRDLLAELDLDSEMRWVETRTGFYTDEQLYSMSNSVEFLKFPPLSLIDKFRLGATIFYASRVSDWKKLEKIPVADWLRKLSGTRTFEKIWLPLLRAKLGENYQKTSAAFIWATIARMYAARRTGLKKEMFGYLPGGYARIINHFAAFLAAEGVNLRTSSGIKSLRSDASGVELTLNDESKVTHDRVVLTVPCPVVSAICPQLTEAEKQRLNAVEYQGIICASVLLRRNLASYYVTNITADWVPFTAVIEMTALVDPMEIGGLHLVYLPKYVTASEFEANTDDAKLEEQFVSALMRMYPGLSRDDVVAFKVSRVRNVFPIPAIDYSEMVPAMATTVPGVSLVNSTHIVNGTLNVNEGVRLANQSAELLLSEE